MKTSLLLKTALGALALAVAVPALAASTPPTPPAASPGQGFRGGPGMGMGPGMGGRMGPGRFRGAPRATPEELAKRRADRFAQIDTNKDGRITEPEFNAYIEARKRERQHQAFLRFSGDQPSVTLDQLNARALERERARERMRENRRGPGGRGGRGVGPGAPPNLGGPPNPPRPGI